MTQLYCLTKGDDNLYTAGSEDRHHRMEGPFSHDGDKLQPITSKTRFERELRDYGTLATSILVEPDEELASVIFREPTELVSLTFVTEPEKKAITRIRHFFSVIDKDAPTGKEGFEVVTSPKEVCFDFTVCKDETHRSYKLRLIPSGPSIKVIMDISERDIRPDSYVTAFRDIGSSKILMPKGRSIFQTVNELVDGLDSTHEQAKRGFKKFIQPAMGTIIHTLSDLGYIHLDAAPESVSKVDAAIEADNAKILAQLFAR